MTKDVTLKFNGVDGGLEKALTKYEKKLIKTTASAKELDEKLKNLANRRTLTKSIKDAKELETRLKKIKTLSAFNFNNKGGTLTTSSGKNGAYGVSYAKDLKSAVPSVVAMTTELETLTMALGFTQAASMSFTKTLPVHRRALIHTKNAFGKLGNGLRGFGRWMVNLKRMFLMTGLAILFAGMLIQRIAMGIMRSATGAFKKVMDTTNNSSYALKRLSAHWEFLKFSIGSAINKALEPLMPWLIKILSWASEWAQKHPEKVFKAIVGAIVVGGTMIAGGSLLTFLSGMVTLFEKLAKIPFKKITSSIKNFFTTAKGKNFSIPLVGALGAAFTIHATYKILDDMVHPENITFIHALMNGLEQGMGIGMMVWAFTGGNFLAAGIAMVLTVAATVTFEFLIKRKAHKLHDMALEAFKKERGENSTQNDMYIMWAQYEKETQALYGNIDALDEYTKRLTKIKKFKMVESGAVENFTEIYGSVQQALTEIETPMQTAATNVDLLATAFGETTEDGLNGAISKAALKGIPSLNVSVGRLTDKLRLQHDQFISTGKAVIFYNKTLTGATDLKVPA